jgi:ABC-type branched-subunit amino acid transport system ATPase component
MGVAMPDLSVEELSVHFGGLVAVDNVSLRGSSGTITGLIGPNGAGKTTTFNACAGAVRSHSGRVQLGQDSLDQLSTAARAARGLGRTFQRIELFDSMTVSQNVALGHEAFLSARRPWSQLASSRRCRRDIADRSDDAIGRCGLDSMAHLRVGDLPTGQRRLVELARAMSTPFRYLLLDEPSSGLDVRETEHFGQIIVDLVAESGIGILLVEHDMALVAKVCSYVYVLDFGQLIYDGSTPDVLSSEIVRAAYLGSTAIGTAGSSSSDGMEAAPLA